MSIIYHEITGNSNIILGESQSHSYSSLLKSYFSMNNFGKWLQEARLERDFTQEQVATAVGYSSGYVSTLERSVVVSKKGVPVRPDIDFVDKVAKFLGRPIAEARLAAGYAPDDKTPGKQDVQTLRVIEYYESLPPDRQNDAIRFLEMMARQYAQQPEVSDSNKSKDVQASSHRSESASLKKKRRKPISKKLAG